jgi:hypothetical protein
MLGFGDRGIGPGQLVRCWLRASQPFDHVIRGALIARGGCSVAAASTAALARRRKESIHQWPALPLTAIFWE